MNLGMINLIISSSKNHFLDTNVLLRHANGDSSPYEADISTILSEAVGPSKIRNVWVSTVIFAELRPSSFKPGVFKTVDELSRYIRSFASIVSPDPATMMRVARLRDLKWLRAVNRHKDEKARTMSLGDAIHIASALWVKEATKVSDLEFLTFDDGKSKSEELDKGTKALSLLRAQEYTDGIMSDDDVKAVCNLVRIKPILSMQQTFTL